MEPDSLHESAVALSQRIRTERPDDIEDAVLDDAPADYTGRAPTVAIQRDELVRFRHSYLTLAMFAAVCCGKPDANDLTFEDLAAVLDELTGRPAAPVIPPDAQIVEAAQPGK
jgi:hypothetical protein